MIGATGAVGAVFLEVAAERNFPIAKLRLLATSRSAGRELRFRDEMITVLETSEESLAGADLVFCSATAEASRYWGPRIAAAGGVLIDDGSAFRMEPNVPLVIPEVNGDDIEWHEGIISIPNCTTTPLALSLHALREVAPLRRVTAATYQAVSGSGHRSRRGAGAAAPRLRARRAGTRAAGVPAPDRPQRAAARR